MLVMLLGTVWVTLKEPAADLKCYAEKFVRISLYDFAGWSCLHYAVFDGDSARVQKMIKGGANIEARSDRGWTPLYVAARNGFIEQVAELHHAGANAVARADGSGLTSLHAAAEYNHHETAELLLDLGVDVDVTNYWDQTPLMQLAWRYGDATLVDLLVSKGGSLNARDNKGFSALHKAAEHGRTDVLKALLRHGADVDIKTNKGSTPLMWAARKNQLESVAILLGAGAAIDNRAGKWTALRYAKDGGFKAIEEMLVSYGAVDTSSMSNEFYLGYELYRGGQFQEAIPYFERWLEQSSVDAKALYYLGRSYEKLGHLELAEKSLQRSVDLDGSRQAAFEHLAWVQLKLNKLERAVENYERFLANEPLNARVLHNLAGVHAKLGNHEEARVRVSVACGMGYQDACVVLERIRSHDQGS